MPRQGGSRAFIGGRIPACSTWGTLPSVHPRPDDRSSVPDRVGNYLIEERLGTGGMGAVYRAFDQALQRPLAIKRLLPETADATRKLRFRREARMAARLNTPRSSTSTTSSRPTTATGS